MNGQVLYLKISCSVPYNPMFQYAVLFDGSFIISFNRKEESITQTHHLLASFLLGTFTDV